MANGGENMEIKVRVFIGNAVVKPEDLHRYKIKNRSIDRIVNEAIKRTERYTEK